MHACMQARLELVNAIGQLYIALGDVLDPADLSDMYSWVERLARNPLAADDSLPVVSGECSRCSFMAVMACPQAQVRGNAAESQATSRQMICALQYHHKDH